MSTPDEMRTLLAALRGTRFVKMTGSGNDFVFFDGRSVSRAAVSRKEVVAAICHRYNGIGADGVVVLEPALEGEPFRHATIHYVNSDGSPADLCGNATLCATRLAAAIGLGSADGMALITPAGRIRSRLTEADPEIDLQAVLDVRPSMPIDLASGETRIGFAMAGIPHLVILSADIEQVDVRGRGPALRHHAATGAAGANVNWVAQDKTGRWHYRTFERGVEGETLACGTGAIATAILLEEWGLSASPIELTTRSGLGVAVRLERPDGGAAGWLPSLRGEGRIVYQGEIGELRHG